MPARFLIDARFGITGLHLEQLTRKAQPLFIPRICHLSAPDTNDTVSIETNYLPALFTLPGNLLLLIGSFCPDALLQYIPLTLAWPLQQLPCCRSPHL